MGRGFGVRHKEGKGDNREWETIGGERENSTRGLRAGREAGGRAGGRERKMRKSETVRQIQRDRQRTVDIEAYIEAAHR